jgi:hypothetical protein
MDDPIKKIQRQTKRYWYVDGLNEIGAGVLIFLLGLLYWVEWLLSPGDMANIITSIGQPILIIGGWLVINWAVRRLKAHLTYPRTGYVAYKRQSGRRRVWGILVSIGVAAGVAFAAVYFGQRVGEKIIPILIGLLMAGSVIYLGYYFGLRRFYLIGAVALGLGTAGAWLDMSQTVAMAVFFSGFGMAWIISGAVTLADYLRRTQPAAEEEE